MQRPINAGSGSDSVESNRENYLNHPSFGLLYRICLVDGNRELFATLYAQRLFFLAIGEGNGFRFEAISRTDARLLVENRLRELRRNGHSKELNEIQAVHKRTFSY